MVAPRRRPSGDLCLHEGGQAAESLEHVRRDLVPVRPRVALLALVVPAPAVCSALEEGGPSAVSSALEAISGSFTDTEIELVNQLEGG